MPFDVETALTPLQERLITRRCDTLECFVLLNRSDTDAARVLELMDAYHLELGAFVDETKHATLQPLYAAIRACKSKEADLDSLRAAKNAHEDWMDQQTEERKCDEFLVHHHFVESQWELEKAVHARKHECFCIGFRLWLGSKGLLADGTPL